MKAGWCLQAFRYGIAEIGVQSPFCSLTVGKYLFFSYINFFICKIGIVSRLSFISPHENQCGIEPDEYDIEPDQHGIEPGHCGIEPGTCSVS